MAESDSPTRAALTQASNWIDRHLANDPERRGRSLRDLPFRILLVPNTGSFLISVIYEVKPEDRFVRILQIRLKK